MGVASDMIPGMGGGNPRQMQMMMRQLGINVEDVPDVEEVVVTTKTARYVFKDCTIQIMKARGGVETWQLSGSPIEEGKSIAEQGGVEDAKLEIADEDIQLVVEQASVSAEKAREALEAAGGDVAEAIVALMDA